MPAKHTSGSGKMQGKGMQRAQRSAANPGILSSKSKLDKGEPITVGRMLKNVKDKLAALRNPGGRQATSAAASSVVDLAKQREAKKKQKRAKAPSVKHPPMTDSATQAAGVDADASNVAPIAKRSGRKRATG